MTKKRNLAIIPARSGSKGLKDKNIKLLNNKPLIWYSINSALKSGIFDTVMVSTDSPQYANIAVDCGAEVPFLRSAITAADNSGSWDVVREVLNNYERFENKEFDTFCLLQPTSPLRTEQDIIKAYDIFNEKNAKAVVSVCEMEHSPLWCNILGQDLSLNGFLSKNNTLPRQSLETYYRINGAIYIASIEEFLENDNLYTENCYAYVMEQRHSVDIDTVDDFEYAEYLIRSYSMYGGI
jgi:CMP-N,N'-diacetyllegionaminic acid synthase